MNERELTVYIGVYDFFQSCIQDERPEIDFDKTVFMLSIGHRANDVDMGRWIDLEGRQFVLAAYLELLRRFPTEEDIRYWTSLADHKRRLIRTIMNSGEFISLHTSVVNDPYEWDRVSFRLRRKLYGDSFEQLSGTWYYRLYMRLPVRLRRLAKSIVGL